MKSHLLFLLLIILVAQTNCRHKHSHDHEHKHKSFLSTHTTVGATCTANMITSLDTLQKCATTNVCDGQTYAPFAAYFDGTQGKAESIFTNAASKTAIEQIIANSGIVVVPNVVQGKRPLDDLAFAIAEAFPDPFVVVAVAAARNGPDDIQYVFGANVNTLGAGQHSLSDVVNCLVQKVDADGACNNVAINGAWEQWKGGNGVRYESAAAALMLHGEPAITIAQEGGAFDGIHAELKVLNVLQPWVDADGLVDAEMWTREDFYIGVSKPACGKCKKAYEAVSGDELHLRYNGNTNTLFPGWTAPTWMTGGPAIDYSVYNACLGHMMKFIPDDVRDLIHEHLKTLQ